VAKEELLVAIQGRVKAFLQKVSKPGTRRNTLQNLLLKEGKNS
jgi:hypothetical protein